MFEIEGECSHCGDCCKLGIVKPLMCENKNIIDGDTYCDFVYKKDGKFVCKVVEFLQPSFPNVKISADMPIEFLEEDVGTISDVKTTLKISDKQAAYIARNMKFPTDREAYRKDLEGGLTPNCTFRIK